MAKRRPWKRSEATTHLEALGEAHDIDIGWLVGGEGYGWTSACAVFGTRQVFIPTPWVPRLYLVGLHEFGHLLSPLAVRLWKCGEETSADESTACEGAAWGWALAHIAPERLADFRRDDFEHVEYGMLHHAWSIVGERRRKLR